MSTFDLLAETIGREAAARMVAEFGGTRLYIPVRVLPDTPLIDAIGADPAARLCARYGGDYLDIPVNPDWGQVRGRIIALNRAGYSTREIARQMRCSRQYVTRVLGEPHA